MNSPDVMFRNGFPLAYQYTSAQPYGHGHQGQTGYYMWSGAAEPAQTLNDTGDSGNSSTMSSGSPPPQEALGEHQLTSLHPHNAHTHAGHASIKVEDAYGGSVPVGAYPGMQNHHFHYQQQIQVRICPRQKTVCLQKDRLGDRFFNSDLKTWTGCGEGFFQGWYL